MPGPFQYSHTQFVPRPPRVEHARPLQSFPLPRKWGKFSSVPLPRKRGRVGRGGITSLTCFSPDATPGLLPPIPVQYQTLSVLVWLLEWVEVATKRRSFSENVLALKAQQIQRPLGVVMECQPAVLAEVVWLFSAVMAELPALPLLQTEGVLVHKKAPS